VLYDTLGEKGKGVHTCIKSLMLQDSGLRMLGTGFETNCSERHIRTYEVTRGPHYDADAMGVGGEGFGLTLDLKILAKKGCFLSSE